MSGKEKHGDVTKRKILSTGVSLWMKDPLMVTPSDIARRMNVRHSTVLYHFRKGLRDAVAKHAVEIGNVKVISQLIICNHKAVKHMSKEEKIEHLRNVFK